MPSLPQLGYTPGTNCRTGGHETVLCGESPLPISQCRDRFSCETGGGVPGRPDLPTRWDPLPYGGVPVPFSLLESDGRESVCGQTLPSGCTLHSADTTGGPRESARDHGRNSWSPDCAPADTCRHHD